MILHFITDDKFADYAIKQFSEPQMQSQFVLMVYGNTVKCVEQKSKTTIIRIGSPEFEQLLKTLGQYSAIVLHGLFAPWEEQVLRAVPNYVKVAWMFWGGEIYGRKDIRRTFLAPRTKLLSWLHTIKKRKANAIYELPIELYQRIDYCLTDMEEEFAFAKKYTQSKMQHFWYNYYSIEETIGSLADCRCNGQDVWLGNSCTIENNYIDAFARLKKRFGNHHLILPLSYGEPWLQNCLLKMGKRMFGDRFVALTKFMPLAEYNHLMLNCGTMIQAHYRPQAQGNIITGLWLGMRVFMSERNLAYAFFKRIGCIVFSLEKEFNNNPQSFEPLPDEQVEHNRSILRQYYSRDVMRKKNEELVKILTQ